MNSIQKAFLLVAGIMVSFGAAAQQTTGEGAPLQLSLADAVSLALKQNLQLQSVQHDEEINRYRIREVTSGMLPQITGDASYNDNFSRASQILPGEVFGQPGTSIAVSFGTRYTLGTGLQVSQNLFDARSVTALKAARASQGYYALNTFKNREDLIYQVVNVYVQLEMTEKQIELMQGNITRMNTLVKITDVQYHEGIIKKVDVDQLKVNQANMSTQLSNTQNTYTQLLNNLKLLMNVDVYTPVIITNQVGAERIPVADQLFIGENTDLAILDYQIRLQQLNTLNIRSGYLPTLAAFANYGYQEQTDKLFDAGATQGFSSGVWGLTLRVPIFDGLAKRNKIAQSNIRTKQLELNRTYATSRITNDFVNTQNELRQNQEVLKSQQANMELAEALYNVAKLSYTEGIAPLSELINAENGLREAQTLYITAMLQTSIAELDLMKTSGQLSKVIRESIN